MTRILIILSIIISIPNISFADVVGDCPTTMSVEGEDTERPIDESNCNAIDGCYWETNKVLPIPGYEGSCEKCPNGKYGAGCKESCPTDFKNSPVGAKDIYECYATCKDAEIPNGKITYTQDTVKYNDHGETCDTFKQINCTKDRGGDFCLSYHWNGDKCVIGWRGSTTEKPDQPIDNCSEYLQYYTSYWVTTKNCLTCADGYSLKKSESVIMPNPTNTCGIDESVGTECMQATIECATALKGQKISTTNTTGWKLSGPTNIQGDVFWDSTQYNYSKCSGEYTGTKMGETKKITCDGITYDSNSNTYKWNNCTLGTSTGCPDDKCIMPMPGESDCDDAHRGYYAESGKTECQACPGGTTTNGTGKTGKSSCQIKTGSSDQEPQTQFCDSTGHCFQLNTTGSQYFDIF